MKKILLTIVMAAAAGVAMYAKDIYVSPQGSDDNAGTLEAPYLTLKKAIENSSAGTTIYLRRQQLHYRACQYARRHGYRRVCHPRQ